MQLPQTTLRFIFYFVRQQGWKFAFIVFASILWGINDSIFPYLIKKIVNTLQFYQGNPHHVYYSLSGILILLFLLWLGSELFLRLQGITTIYAFPKFRAQMRKSVFDYVKSHSQEYFANHFAGNIAKKLADLPTSSQTIVEIVCFQFVTASIGATLVFFTMWFTKPIFAIILLIWLILHMGTTLLFLRYANLLWERHSDAVSILSGKIVDVFSNILNVRIFASGLYESTYLEKFQQEEITEARKAMWLVEIMRIVLAVNSFLLIFTMIFTLLQGWIYKWVSLGDFTQIGMQTFWLMGWVWFVSFQISIFAREAGTISDALNLIKKSHDLQDTSSRSIQIEKGVITYENVVFSYNKNKLVFDNLNIQISAGEKVGLVGFSGSGKSTFVNLLLRFYDVKSGRILIDNQNISEVTQDSLRSQIAMIPQDPSLFHRSLIENIRYGRLTATDEEVIAAAKLAHCHEFIEKLDCGYQTLVGERGIKLSGGQRQRIAIARAILKNAPILILDEATSSLDSVTEKLIHEGLTKLMQGKTTIVIAHRLSTLADMDRILVFHQGKIIEEGTQESLLNQNGHFAKLWQMQVNGFLPDKIQKN